MLSEALSSDALVMTIDRLSFMCDTGDDGAGMIALAMFLSDARPFFDVGILDLSVDEGWTDSMRKNAYDLVSDLAILMECLAIDDDRALAWMDDVIDRARG